MCGICGFTGQLNHDLLAAMGTSIIHRGPDAAGYYEADGVSLCSRRLSILDIEGGTQPIINEASDIILVWNGEIYNYPELMKELKDKGYTFRTDHSDTEILMKMYEEYGLDFVNRLNGMYAIAIFDKRNSTIYLIRDRIGVKPLFYFFNGTDIIFSSEIKGILLHPAYQKEINYSAVYDYFSFNNVLAPHTAFNNIYSVMPANVVTFHNGELTASCYWAPDFSGSCTDTFDTAADILRYLIEDSVRLRLNADVEVGGFLSGGIDSSIITSFASKYTDRISTFTLYEHIKDASLHDKESDVRYSRMIADIYNTRHHEYTINADELVSSMPAIMRAFDQPFAGAVSTYFISKFASENNIKCAICGDGADEIFGGYLPHQVIYGVNNPDTITDSYTSNLLSTCGTDKVKLLYSMLQLDDENKKMFLNNEIFDSNINTAMTYRHLQDIFNNKTSSDYMNDILEYSCRFTLPTHVLSYSDALSMANSLEIRSPFLDYRIMEYTASLPGNVKNQSGISKELLKQVCRNIIPDEIIDRPKEWFSLPIQDWMKYELKEYVTDMLSPDFILKYNILQPDMIYFMTKKYYSDPIAFKNLANVLWNFTCFQEWCDQYL